MHEKSGITPIFPIWSTQDQMKALAYEMISSGVRAILMTIDPRKLSPSYAGRNYDKELIDNLPENIDPCGEFGEFHTLCVDGPAFSYPIPVTVKECIERDNFVYTEIVLDPDSNGSCPKPIPLCEVPVHINEDTVKSIVSESEIEELRLLSNRTEILCKVHKDSKEDE